MKIPGYSILTVSCCYARIYEPSTDAHTGLLVPVWDFFGSRKIDSEYDGETYSDTTDWPTWSFLTINAVDGSIIDRSLDTIDRHGVVALQFLQLYHNPKVIYLPLSGYRFHLAFTGRIMVVMDNYNTPVQAIEPFLWTFGDGTAVLLSSMLLLLLFSDLPKMTQSLISADPATKKKWLLESPVCLYYIQ